MYPAATDARRVHVSQTRSKWQRSWPCFRDFETTIKKKKKKGHKSTEEIAVRLLFSFLFFFSFFLHSYLFDRKAYSTGDPVNDDGDDDEENFMSSHLVSLVPNKLLAATEKHVITSLSGP